MADEKKAGFFARLGEALKKEGDANAGLSLKEFAEKKLADPSKAVPQTFAAIRSGVREAQEGLDPSKIAGAFKAGLARPVEQSPGYGDIAERAGVKSPLALASIETAGQMLEPSGAPMGVSGTIKKMGNAVKFGDEAGSNLSNKVIQKIGDARKTPAAVAGRAQVAEQVAQANKMTPKQSAEQIAKQRWAEQGRLEAAKAAARVQYSRELSQATTKEQLASIKARMDTFIKVHMLHNK